jgi:8-oxo-dGTP pyrophosphatase MutT (NUDIX family)
VNAGDVLALLDRLAPADDREATYLAMTRGHLISHPQPWSRFDYEPGHVTASAFVLHPTDESIALVHHAKIGIWVQPGGHVEATDPDHEAAARREIREEIGIRDVDQLGLLDIDIHVFPSRGEQPEHLHFDLRWALRARTAEIEAGDGAVAARWVPLSEAITMDESIARPTRKLVGLLGRAGPHG